MNERYFVAYRLGQFFIIDRVTGESVDVSTAEFAAIQICRRMNGR